MPTANCQLPTAFADEITIRTIVTPIGSQSEKWGAAGLMVCIGGETIPNGGCGVDAFSNPILSGFKMKENGTKEDVTGLFKVNDIVIFKDTHENHQYDYDSGDESDSDTVYEVRGSGGGECVIVSNSGVDCQGGIPFTITRTASCPSGYSIKSACTGTGTGGGHAGVRAEVISSAMFCSDNPTHSCVGNASCVSSLSVPYGTLYGAVYVRILCCE